jgi:hypothetical protein
MTPMRPQTPDRKRSILRRCGPGWRLDRNSCPEPISRFPGGRRCETFSRISTIRSGPRRQQFVAYLDAIGAEHLTIEHAVAWAKLVEHHAPLVT